MLQKHTLIIYLMLSSFFLGAQSQELQVEQLKAQIYKAQQLEGKNKAMALSMMGLAHIDPNNVDLQRLLFESYYSGQDEELYFEEELAQEATFLATTWSPDGKTLAVGLSDGSVRFYDQEGQQIKAFQVLEYDEILNIDFAPNGQHLAIGTSASSIDIIDLDGKILHSWDQNDYVRTVAWSHNGKMLAAGGDDNIVYLYDTDSKQELAQLNVHKDWIRNLSWSAQDDFLAVASDDGTASVWDIKTKSLVAQHTDHEDYCRDVAFSPDRQPKLVSSSDDLTLQLYDNISADKSTKAIDDFSEWIMAVDWSKNGKYIATGGNAGAVKLINTNTYAIEPLHNITEGYIISDIDFSSNNQHLAACSPQSLFIYDLNKIPSKVSIAVDEKPQSSTTTNDNPVADEAALEESLNTYLPNAVSISFSADKKRIAIIDNNYEVSVIDAMNGALLYTLSGHTDWIRNIAWSANNQYLATASDDMMAGIWNAQTGELIHFLSGHTDWVRDVDFSPDNKLLTSAGDDGVLRIWDVETGKELNSMGSGENFLMTIDWSPKGSYMASQNSEGALTIWTTKDNKALFQSNNNTQEGSVLWKDDENLVVSSVEGEVFEWNAKTGLSVSDQAANSSASSGAKAYSSGHYVGVKDGGKDFLLQGHQSGIAKLVWSPDGKYLLSFANDNMLGIWEAPNYNLVAMISASAAISNPVIWSKDNQSFLVAGAAKIYLPASNVLELLKEESFSAEAYIEAQDILNYELEKIFLLNEKTRNSLLENAEADLLLTIADFYEQRAAARQNGAAKTKDTELSERFRSKAQNK